MTRINTNYKAEDVIAPADVAPEPNLTQTNADLQTALAELEQFKEENAEWLSEENLNELERLEVMMKAESAAIAGYGISGPDGAGANGATENSGWRPQGLQPLWNGIRPEDIDTSAVPNFISGNPSHWGDYAGTVTIINSGRTSDPTRVGFQMTDDMTALWAESRGRDIAITVKYQDDSLKTWILKDGTVRPEPIIISAQGLTHKVTIDCSKAFRVADGSVPGYPAGMRSGFYIHGSEHDDYIYGTQGADGIAGYKGNDTIDGGAGADLIYGDEVYDNAGEFAADGGNDTIRGGADKDIIYGGGGTDTPYATDNGEGVYECEGEAVANKTEIDDALVTSLLGETDDESWTGAPGVGEAVITRGAGSDKLVLTMPDGYNMAYAEQGTDGQSLIITLVGEKKVGGVSVSLELKIRVEGFFNENCVTRLEFNGNGEDNIIDFSRVELTSQVVNILGNGGDDILLNARYAVLSQGVDITRLDEFQRTTPSERTAFRMDIFSGYGEDEENPYTVGAPDVNGVFTIEGDYNADKPLKIVAPEGYDTAYIAEGDENFIYLVLVKGNEDGNGASTLVVKIDKDVITDRDENIQYGQILVGRAEDSGTAEAPETSYNWTSITPVVISMLGTDYIVDGGAGTGDLVFTQKGTRVQNAEDELDVEIDPELIDEDIDGSNL